GHDGAVRDCAASDVCQLVTVCAGDAAGARLVVGIRGLRPHAAVLDLAAPRRRAPSGAKPPRLSGIPGARALSARAGDLVIIRRGDAALRRAARPLPSDSFVWECSRSVPPPLDSVRWPDRNLPTSGQTSRRNAGRPNSVHIPSDEWRPRVTSDTPTETESLSEAGGDADLLHSSAPRKSVSRSSFGATPFFCSRMPALPRSEGRCQRPC